MHAGYRNISRWVSPECCALLVIFLGDESGDYRMVCLCAGVVRNAVLC